MNHDFDPFTATVQESAPAPTTADYRALDAAHHLHPFSDMGALNRAGSRVIVKADGVYLWDSDGNRVIDGMAGLWCVNVGYGRQELAQAAYRQLRELPYYNTFFKTTHPPVIALSALLAALTPAPFKHFFYCNSGSEGNDTALRIVYRYWAAQGKASKKYVIARKNGYHGSTIAGATLGGMDSMHEQMPSKVEHIVHIDQPYFFGEAPAHLSSEAFGLEHRLGDRLAQVANIDRLEIALARNDGKNRKVRHGCKAVGEFVLWPEDQRRTDDRRPGKYCSDGRLSFGLGPAVSRLGLQTGANRRDMDQRLSAKLPRSFGNIAGAIDMDLLHFGSEHAAEVHDRARAMDRAADALSIGDVRYFEAELADLAERLDDIGLARIALGNPHPHTAAEQEFADIAADKSAAAEQGYELF